MPRYSGEIKVGDVLVTREGGKLISGGIRFGAWLRGRPAIVNHVIIAHHIDAQGVWWGIEDALAESAGGTLTNPLRWAHTNANPQQPKSDGQREEVAGIVEQLLGTPYDWEGIAEDVRDALRFSWRLEEWREGEVPGGVVCSSLADFAYERAGLANPGGSRRTRHTTPGDWDEFMIKRQWR